MVLVILGALRKCCRLCMWLLMSLIAVTLEAQSNLYDSSHFIKYYLGRRAVLS